MMSPDDVLRLHLEKCVFELDEETGFIYRVKQKYRNRFNEGLVACDPHRADIHKSSNGYLRVFLTYAGNRFTIMAHRLVVILKNNNLIENGFVVDHINHIRTDNRPVNLDVVTWEKTTVSECGVKKL